MTLREILVEIARIAGRSPPRIRLPNAALLPIAYAAEAVGRLTWAIAGELRPRRSRTTDDTQKGCRCAPP